MATWMYVSYSVRASSVFLILDVCKFACTPVGACTACERSCVHMQQYTEGFLGMFVDDTVIGLSSSTPNARAH